ncbi:Major sperm protein 78 [Trichinella sp. T8]|nr:Major sperm protein 78 [Trichinella sp. T8]
MKWLRSSRKETPKKDETEASTGHGALASSSMDISDSLEGRRCEQVSTLQEAKEVMATSNHVLNVVVLPPTAGDSGSDDTDQEYLPDDPEDESDPAVLSRYNCQPEAKNYWPTQPDMGAQCAISCMARNRFMEIKKYLHLADNQKLVKGDKMSKVTPLYKLLNSSLVKHEAKNYWPTQPDMGAQCAISCMARNRFMEIKKYLHLADNQKLVKGDKMSKVTPLYKLLNSSLVKHGSDDTDQEYLPDDPEDESDPAGELEVEQEQFIGVIVLSRYNCQPEAKNYWPTQPDMGAQCAISCMARNRFMEIKKYLHLADNQKLVKGDKMSKVTPLYKLLNSSLVKHDQCSFEESCSCYRMALPTDIVTVPAEEVWFNAPCLSEQVTALKLSNPGNRLLGYKVVSKVENRYVVLPSQGALQPKKDITINIICHPFPFRSESPPVDTLIIEWVDAFESETDFNEDWFVMGGIVRKKVLSVKFNP